MNTYPITVPAAPSPFCSTPDCGRASRSKGLCKRCYYRAYYAAHPDRQAESNRRWRAKHPEYNADIACNQQAIKRATKLGSPIIERVIRSKVLKRQDGKCTLCLQPVEPGNAHLDHRVPLSWGGEHSYANAQALHAKCHRRKSRIERAIKADWSTDGAAKRKINR